MAEKLDEVVGVVGDNIFNFFVQFVKCGGQIGAANVRIGSRTGLITSGLGFGRLARWSAKRLQESTPLILDGGTTSQDR